MQNLGRRAGNPRLLFGAIVGNAVTGWEVRAMRLAIEIIAAALLVICVSVSSAAAGKLGRSADGLSCAFSVPANASPAARCAAIRRQCGGKFYASTCGDRMLANI